LWQVVELNTFFVKHIFPMPAEHPICVARILLTGLMAAPSARYIFGISCFVVTR
jgi:phosphatidylserine synthase 1